MIKAATRWVPLGVVTSALRLVKVSNGENPLTRRFSICISRTVTVPASPAWLASCTGRPRAVSSLTVAPANQGTASNGLPSGAVSSMRMRPVTGCALFSAVRASVKNTRVGSTPVGFTYWAVEGAGSLIGTFMPIAQPDNKSDTVRAVESCDPDERRRVLMFPPNDTGSQELHDERARLRGPAMTASFVPWLAPPLGHGTTPGACAPGVGSVRNYFDSTFSSVP